MNGIFETVAEEFLRENNRKYYKGGKELKVGDKIISGCTIGYSNLSGVSSSTFYNHDDASRVNLNMFVYDETSKMLFQLYSIKN
jgi:hypothetical protein